MSAHAAAASKAWLDSPAEGRTTTEASAHVCVSLCHGRYRKRLHRRGAQIKTLSARRLGSGNGHLLRFRWRFIYFGGRRKRRGHQKLGAGVKAEDIFRMVKIRHTTYTSYICTRDGFASHKNLISAMWSTFKTRLSSMRIQTWLCLCINLHITKH